MAALIVEKGVSVVLLNKISIRSVGALGSLLVFAASSQAAPLPPQKASPEAQAMEQGRKLLAGRSARFVENKGQWKQEARFLAESRNLNLWYTDKGIRYDQTSNDNRRRQAVDMFFVGGQSSHPQGVSKLNSEIQIIHSDKTVRGIRSYKEIVKRNVVPGVDMRGYYDGGKPRYDLIVAPGAKPSSITLGFRGSNGLSLSKGALKIGTNFGGIFNGKPVAYQVVNGKHVPVAAAWTVAEGTAKFKIGSYDSHRPLVIDPVVYGTYFGGIRGPDEIRAALTDTFGGVNNGLFIVGSSSAPDFPGTSLPFSDTLNPTSTDAFVARIATSGTATDLSIFIGGRQFDVAQYVRQNPFNGDIYFAGTTISGSTQVNGSFNTFPTTTDNVITTGHQKLIGTDTANSTNYFVGRFIHQYGTLSYGEDGTGTPRFATILGTGVASSSTASAYMTGFDINAVSAGYVQMAISGVSPGAISTGLINFPDGISSTSPVALRYGYTSPGHRAGFLLRFEMNDNGGNASSADVYKINFPSSQYVVGSRSTELRGVVLDKAGKAYTVGTVYNGTPVNVDTSQDPSFFDTTPGAIANTNGSTVLGRLLRAADVFVRIYAPYNTQVGFGNLVFSGLYGGNGTEEAGGVAASLSVTAGGSAIPIYTGSAIAIDADQNIYFTGTTFQSANFPYTAGAYFHYEPPAGNQNRNTDIFVARLSTGGTRLDYSTNLKAFAGITATTFAPSRFSTAMPAGIAVDGRGYVYLTGNLRAYAIQFPGPPYTPGSVLEPSSFRNSTLPVGEAANTIDTVFDTPSSGKFPTTEGFLVVLNPSFSALQFASYVGGTCDDLVYAPSFDSSGNVLITGWTDGARIYTTPFYTGGQPEYQEYDGGVPGFIGSAFIKNIPDASGSFQIGDFGYNIWGTDGSAQAGDQVSMQINVGRDGFVSSVSPNLPAAVNPTIALSFSPASIAALGTSTGTVTLNTAQPLKTVVTITGPVLVGLSASDIAISGLTPTGTANTYTLTIPSGQTSASFTVKSVTVANGGAASFTATIPSGTDKSTSTAGITIGGLSFTMTLNPSVVVGSTAGTTVTGTLTLPAPSNDPSVSSKAPTTLNFIVTVPNNAANRTIFNVGTGNPFAAVDANDPTKLDLTTATIAAGDPTGTFTFKVGSPTAPTALIVTASTVANSTVGSLTATASLTVNPVGLVGITPKQSTLRGGRDQLVLTVIFNGPVSSGDAFSLAYSLGGVFPPTTSASPTLNTTIGALAFVGVNSSGQYVYTYTANSNRVSRSQDIQILATYKGTTASTAVTVVR